MSQEWSKRGTNLMQQALGGLEYIKTLSSEKIAMVMADHQDSGNTFQQLELYWNPP